MLKVLSILGNNFPRNYTGELLFKENPKLRFTIKAPVYWWIDCDWVVYGQSLPTQDLEFCFDGWDEYTPLIRYEKVISQNPNLTPRQIMQILPMSTYMEGVIELSYREIVEVCENRDAGEYVYTAPYSFPNEAEWNDFCKELLKIQGVKDLLEDE